MSYFEGDWVGASFHPDLGRRAVCPGNRDGPLFDTMGRRPILEAGWLLRSAIGLVVAMGGAALLGVVHAEPGDESLLVYAVNIIQDPAQSWTGYGIYLGRGLVITAAHAIGSAARTKPSVRIAGLVLPATAVREGAYERVDLTLLSIDEQKLPVGLRMRRMPVCQKSPWPGEPVIVAVPEGTCAIAYHVAAVASYCVPDAILHGDQRRCDHREFRIRCL